MLRLVMPKGFCLLELLVALILMGLLAAFSLPTTKRLLYYSSLKQETLNLCTAIETLGLAAQQKEERLALVFSKHEYRVFVEKDPKRVLIKRTLRPPIAVNLDSPFAEQALTLHFYPSGAVTPHSLELTDGEHRCLVTVSLRGRATCTC